MNRLLYNPRLTAKYFLTLDDLLWLNYLADNKDQISYSTLCKYSESISNVSGEEPFFNLCDKELIDKTDMDNIKLTSKGKAFFAEDTILSPGEYEYTSQILLAWNRIPETTTHKVRLQDEPQTKTVFKIAQIASLLFAGKLHPLIKESKYQDGPIPRFKPIILKDLIDTINDYALKFSEDYYPDNKKNLPTTILDFFMNHRYLKSEFFTTYFDGVIRKKTGTVSTLAEYGITPKTLKKVYDVMLSPSDRNSESMKYKCMKQLLLVHSQWSMLIDELDQYYLWNKKYRDLCRDFNFYVFDYVTWMGNNVGGEKHLMYLQVKENHEIYAQFRAFYHDQYQISLKVSKKNAEYLLNKNKKYKEGKK